MNRLVEIEVTCGTLRVSKRGPLDVLSLLDRLILRPLFLCVLNKIVDSNKSSNPISGFKLSGIGV